MRLDRSTMALLAVMTLMAGLGAGCSTSPRMAPRDVRVTLGQDMRDREGKLNSVQVDLIGVNNTELDRWTNVAVDEYWKVGSTLAASPNKYTLKFDAKDVVDSKLLAKNDPVWQKWEANGALWLVVIENVQGLAGSGAGAQDPRRLVIPLDEHRWDELGEVKITSTKAGLSLVTPPKPVKQ